MLKVDRRDFIAQGVVVATAAGLAAGFDMLNGRPNMAFAKELSSEDPVNVTKLLMDAGLKFAPPFPSKDTIINDKWTAIWSDPAKQCDTSLDNICDECYHAVEELARAALRMILRDGPGVWKTITTPTIVSNPFAYHIGERDRKVEFHAFIHLGKEEPDEAWVHRRVLRSVRASGSDLGDAGGR